MLCNLGFHGASSRDRQRVGTGVGLPEPQPVPAVSQPIDVNAWHQPRHRHSQAEVGPADPHGVDVCRGFTALALCRGVASALGAFEGQWQSYEPEAGSSKAHTYQWLTALAELGRVDTSVTADTAHYAVFEDSGARAYAAFNPGASPITVTFSDGTTLTVRLGEPATE
ncbi:hypothetical protein NOGI109294_08035 [Nocardiopsis gilva]